MSIGQQDISEDALILRLLQPVSQCMEEALRQLEMKLVLTEAPFASQEDENTEWLISEEDDSGWQDVSEFLSQEKTAALSTDSFNMALAEVTHDRTAASSDSTRQPENLSGAIHDETTASIQQLEKLAHNSHMHRMQHQTLAAQEQLISILSVAPSNQEDHQAQGVVTILGQKRVDVTTNNSAQGVAGMAAAAKKLSSSANDNVGATYPVTPLHLSENKEHQKRQDLNRSIEGGATALLSVSPINQNRHLANVIPIISDSNQSKPTLINGFALEGSTNIPLVEKVNTTTAQNSLALQSNESIGLAVTPISPTGHNISIGCSFEQPENSTAFSVKHRQISIPQASRSGFVDDAFHLTDTQDCKTGTDFLADNTLQPNVHAHDSSPAQQQGRTTQTTVIEKDEDLLLSARRQGLLP